MNIVAQPDVAGLPALLDRAVSALAKARTAAEILEAGQLANVAYDLAKTVSRFAQAKSASDELIAAAHVAQANALEIESLAQQRLATEYDSAKARGEFGRHAVATLKDIGVSPTQLFMARRVRDAEVAAPGIVRTTLDDALASGHEPTKHLLRRALASALPPRSRPVKPSAAMPSIVVDCRTKIRTAVTAALKRMPDPTDRFVLFCELEAELRRLKAIKPPRGVAAAGSAAG